MKEKIKNKAFIIPAIVCGVIIIAVVLIYILAPVSKSNETQYLYIDNDDTMDSVIAKASETVSARGITTITILARHTKYNEHIRSGRYAIESNISAIKLFRTLRNGLQSPLKWTVPSVRTKKDLAKALSKNLMISSDSVYAILNDSVACAKYGFDTVSIVSMFIPDTYEIYWNTSADKLLEKMHKTYQNFWTEERKSKAKKLGLSEYEVITLASIVEEETAANKEKPTIAGLYYNRLQQNILLQADPTVKFALQDFGLRRILNKHLTVDSPYNTYKYAGLPPGPIRIPSTIGIDAVLNLEHHEYIYMCANSDFSGTHKFAATYQEHQKNAAEYVAELNKRNIK